MCYLNQVKQCKTNTMLFSTTLNKTQLRFCVFPRHLKQNPNNAMYHLNHVTHNIFNPLCFNQFKHCAYSTMCYLSPIKHCKTSAMLYLNYCILTQLNQRFVFFIAS